MREKPAEKSVLTLTDKIIRLKRQEHRTNRSLHRQAGINSQIKKINKELKKYQQKTRNNEPSYDLEDDITF